MTPALRGRRSVTFAVLAVSVSSFALLQSLIVPVLATIQREFDTDQNTVTWVLTAYLLSASIATPLLGRVGDVVGKTRMLVITLGALAFGSALAALAPSIGWLIFARVVQGAGGGVLPLAFGIVLAGPSASCRSSCRPRPKRATGSTPRSPSPAICSSPPRWRASWSASGRPT